MTEAEHRAAWPTNEKVHALQRAENSSKRTDESNVSANNWTSLVSQSRDRIKYLQKTESNGPGSKKAIMVT